MKRVIIIIYLLVFISFFYPYEKIVNWENKEIRVNKLFFKNGHFFGEKNKKIALDSVSYIIFNLKDDEGKKEKLTLDNVTADELLRRASIMGEKYHDSSILVLYDDGVQKLNKDGTRYSRSRYSVKIMNEKELSHAILSFYYEKGKYENKIIMARSISSDGKISNLKKSDISYTTPKQGLSFFSGKKDEKIIKATIPNVEVGSIVDYEWETIEDSPEDKNQFYTGWFFASDKPVFESTVKFIVPEEKKFYWATKNFIGQESKPIIKKHNGYKIYSFKKQESPPFIKEPYCPPMGELVSSIFGSVFPDQKYLSSWLSKFMKERMTPTDKLKDIVKKLLRETNAKSEEEKVSSLYRFVQGYIHYRSIKTSLSSGFSGHPAQETFDNRYGDCIDKSILFSTLLNIANIKAYPVIITTNNKPRALYNEIGVVAGNHAITEVHLKEKTDTIIYLDSTSVTYRYPVFRSDDQGVPAWNPILNTVREIEPLDSVWNTQKINKEIILSSDGNGTVKNFVEYFGDLEAGLRGYFLSIKEKEIKSLLSSIIAGDYPGSILKEYNFTNPTDYSTNLSLNFSYEAVEVAKKTADFLIMNIPVSYDFSYITLKDRKYPLVFPTTGGKKYKISITIPDEYKIKGLPDSINIKNKYFSYIGNYSLDNNVVIFEDHLKRDKCRIKTKDYEQFRDEILKIDHFIRTPLIFEKKSN